MFRYIQISKPKGTIGDFITACAQCRIRQANQLPKARVMAGLQESDAGEIHPKRQVLSFFVRRLLKQ